MQCCHLLQYSKTTKYLFLHDIYECCCDQALMGITTKTYCKSSTIVSSSATCVNTYEERCRCKSLVGPVRQSVVCDLTDHVRTD